MTNPAPTPASTTSATGQRLGSQTLYLIFGNAFTLAVGLPLQIYVARVLGPVGLGIYGLMEAAIATVTSWLAFGIAPMAMRFIPAHLERREFGSIRSLVRMSSIALLVSGGCGFLVLVVAVGLVDDFSMGLASYHVEAIVMSLLLPLGLLLYFLQQALRGFQEIRFIVIGSSILQLTVKAMMAIGAFAIGGALGGYIAATVVSTTAAVAWMAYGLRKRIRALPQKSAETSGAGPRAEWRRYAAVSYSTSILSSAVGALDRFLLGVFVGPAAVGALVVVRQLHQMPQVFNQMLLTVGAPMLSAAHARDDASERQRIYALMTDWVVRASLPLVIFLLMFGSRVLLLYGDEFAKVGTPALAVLVWSGLFNLVCGPVGYVALMSGLEKEYLRVMSVATVIGVASLGLLVPFLGVLGASMATAIHVIFVNTALVVVVRRALQLRWWDPRFARWLFPAGASLAVAVALKSVETLDPLGLALGLAGTYAAFAFASLAQGLNSDDRDLVRYVFDKLFDRSRPA